MEQVSQRRSQHKEWRTIGNLSIVKCKWYVSEIISAKTSTNMVESKSTPRSWSIWIEQDKERQMMALGTVQCQKFRTESIVQNISLSKSAFPLHKYLVTYNVKLWFSAVHSWKYFRSIRPEFTHLYVFDQAEILGLIPTFKVNYRSTFQQNWTNDYKIKEAKRSYRISRLSQTRISIIRRYIGGWDA